jgi:CheY-like chemotaxis protein
MGKLLVVDDDEALRRLMCLELSDTYEMIDSGNPEQGLALALEHKPDAILLDLRMSKYSGYELLQTFTSFRSTKMIPVIIVSGEAGGQTKDQCKRLGAVGYFEKPIDFDALRSCLQQFAKKRRHIPRSEVRVQLCIPLKLRGSDSQGKQFDKVATTENVSLSGFMCHCTDELPANCTLDVHLMNHRDEYVGKAKIIHSRRNGESLWHYGCSFIEKTGPWVLQ